MIKLHPICHEAKQSKAKATNRPNTKPNAKQTFHPPTQSKYLLTKLVWGVIESLPHFGQFTRWKKSMHGDTWSQLVARHVDTTQS